MPIHAPLALSFVHPAQDADFMEYRGSNPNTDQQQRTDFTPLSTLASMLLPSEF